MLTDYFVSHGLSLFASGWSQFAGAFGLSFLIMLLFGRGFVRAMHAWQKKGQPISENVPDAHRKKAGTPTMGGILIVFAILLIFPEVLGENGQLVVMGITLVGFIFVNIFSCSLSLNLPFFFIISFRYR